MVSLRHLSKFRLFSLILIAILLLVVIFLGTRKYLIKGAFIDVPKSAPYYWQVDAIAKAGITVGYPSSLGLTYRPNDQVTRAMMAVYLVRAMKLPLVNPDTPTFADVPKTASYYQYVEAIAKAGITAGCANNPTRYCPDDKVNKSQTAVFLQRAIKLQLVNPATPSFQDVAKIDGFYQHVESIYQAGIIEGCLPQKYCPNEVVTRGQIAIYLVRAFKIPYGQGTINGNVAYLNVSGGFDANKYAAEVLDQNSNKLATSNTNGYATTKLAAGSYSLSGKYQQWKQVNNVNITLSGPFDFRKENNNLVYNPGFETQNYGNSPFWDTSKAELGVWNLYAQTGSATVIAEAKNSGSQGLKIVDTANSGTSAAFQIIPASPNVSYNLSAFAKKISGSDGQIMYLRFLDGNRNSLGEKTATFNSTSWQKQVVTATSPANTVYIMVILYSYNTGISAFYWDDVSLTKTDGTDISNLIFKADDLKMAMSATVSGEVVDGDSNDLLSGVQVEAISKDANGNTLGDVKTTSDSSGKFSFDNVCPGKVTLSGTKDNYTPQPSTFDVQSNQTLPDQQAILVPNANTISGTIKDDTGQGLSASMTVSKAASFYGQDMTFSTDWQGNYKAVGVLPGVTAVLKISAANFLDQTVSQKSPSGTRQVVTLNFVFVTSGSGAMVDTRTGGFTTGSNCAKDTNGNAISDAYVVLSNGGTYSGGEYPEQKYYLKTDANGCITLNNIPAGIYGVVIFRDFPDGTTKYYALPGEESQIQIDHAGTTDFPLNGLQEVTP